MSIWPRNPRRHPESPEGRDWGSTQGVEREERGSAASSVKVNSSKGGIRCCHLNHVDVYVFRLSVAVFHFLFLHILVYINCDSWVVNALSLSVFVDVKKLKTGKRA